MGLIFSKIKICFTKIDINNYSKNEPNIVKDFDGKVNVYWLGIIKIFSLKFDRSILTKYTFEDFINNKTNERIVRAFSLKDFKLIKLKLEKLDFTSNIGTEDAVLTSVIIFVISSVITFIVAKSINARNIRNYKYKLIPNYSNKNVFSFKVNCIISIETAHIIYMILIMLKRLKVKSKN